MDKLVLENIQVIAKPQFFYYGQTVVLENIQIIAKPHISFLLWTNSGTGKHQVIAKPHVSFLLWTNSGTGKHSGNSKTSR